MSELFEYGSPNKWEAAAENLVRRLLENWLFGNLACEFSDTMRESNGRPWLITLDPECKMKIEVRCLVSDFVPWEMDDEEVPRSVKFHVRSEDHQWEFAVAYHFADGLDASWHNKRCTLADHTSNVAFALGDADALRQWLMMWRLLAS